MVKKHSIEEGNKIERAQFDLQLPSEIDLLPWQVVLLPRNKKAMIYVVPVWDRDRAKQQADAYDVYVVSQTTLAVVNDYHYGNKHRFENIPEVKHFLLNTTRQLSIKKTTRKTVNVQDLSDVDDDD